MASTPRRRGAQEEADKENPSGEDGCAFPSDEDEGENLDFLGIETPSTPRSLPRHRPSAPPISGPGRLRFASDGDAFAEKRPSSGRRRRFTSEDDVDCDEVYRRRNNQSSSPLRACACPFTPLRRLDQQRGVSLGAAQFSPVPAPISDGSCMPHRTLSRFGSSEPSSPYVVSGSLPQRSISASAALSSPVMTPSRRRRRPRGAPLQPAPLTMPIGPYHRTATTGVLSLSSSAVLRVTWTRMRAIALVVLAIVGIFTDETLVSKIVESFVQVTSESVRQRELAGERTGKPPAFSIDHGREIALFPPHPPEMQRSEGSGKDVDVIPPSEDGTKELDQGTGSVGSSPNKNPGKGIFISPSKEAGRQRRGGKKARRPLLSFARDGGAGAMPIFQPPEAVLDSRTLHPRERIIHDGHDFLVRRTTTHPSIGINPNGLKRFVLEDTGVADIRLVRVTGPGDEGERGILLPMFTVLVVLAGVTSLAVLLFGSGQKRNSSPSNDASGQRRVAGTEGTGLVGGVRMPSPLLGKKKWRDCTQRTL